jgi:hypothetical protein
MKKGREEGMVGTLCQCSLKAVECGEWQRDARIMEASIGRSGRQARTSRNRQGPHRPASALNTRGCLPLNVLVLLMVEACLRCLLLGMQLHVSSAVEIIRGMRGNQKGKGDAVVDYELVEVLVEG